VVHVGGSGQSRGRSTRPRKGMRIVDRTGGLASSEAARPGEMAYLGLRGGFVPEESQAGIEQAADRGVERACASSAKPGA
jgi:hypothetical protein